MDVLPTIWFFAIGVLWIGYLILEGFDLGVGMHLLSPRKATRSGGSCSTPLARCGTAMKSGS